MSERDELRIKLLGFGGTISSCWPERGGVFDQKKAEHAADETADAILAAGYRKPQQVTTVEELAKFGAESVILDANGTPWVSDGDTDQPWASVCEDPYGGPVWSDSEGLTLPATVLHVGGAQ